MSNLSPKIDQQRLSQVLSMDLRAGGHDDLSRGMCILEAVSFVAREEWSDHPQCVCPAITSFLRSWNDGLPDDERNALLRDLIPKVVGTRSTRDVEWSRALLALDWLVRQYLPAWLRLTHHAESAVAFEATPTPGLSDIDALRSKLESLSSRLTGDVDAPVSHDRHWLVIPATAGTAARAVVRDAIWSVGWGRQGFAAAGAANDALTCAGFAAAIAKDHPDLLETRRHLQQSAKDLVQRMIAVEV